MDGANRDRLARFFYKQPEREVYVRELARELDRSPGYVSQHITELVEAGLVEETHRGNQRVFTANTDDRRYRQAKIAANLREFLTADVVGSLADQLYPDAVVLFGSYLQGTDTPDSDIDIAVINGRETAVDLTAYEQKFARRITLTHVDDLGAAEPEFVNTLANGLTVHGYVEVV